MPIDPKDFRRALGRFASGVTVITVRASDGSDHGMTASAFSSLSLDPPLVLVCVRKETSTHAHLLAARSYAVNLLGESEVALSNRFAGIGPLVADRFADLSFHRAPASQAVWFDAAICGLDCRLHDTADGGDHTIFIGAVEGTHLGDGERPPLIYWNGAYRSLGAKL